MPDFRERERFTERVLRRVSDLDSRLVVGVDPDPELLEPSKPAVRRAFGDEPGTILRRFCEAVLEAVCDQAACVKPQAAFFEAWGPRGMEVLAGFTAGARKRAIPIILDAKRGDVGNTARAYARAYLYPESPFFSDALTVNPYLGEDSLAPFIEACRENGTGLFILVRSSNPAAGTVQSLALRDGGTVAESIASMVDRLGRDLTGPSGYSLIGAVVGLTHPGDLVKLRNLMPRSLLLLPGLGAQGGKARDAALAFHPGGKGALVSASRSITMSFLETLEEDGLTYERVVEDIRTRARLAREELNEALIKSST